MCQDCPTTRSRVRAVVLELVADVVVLPLYLAAVAFGLVWFSYVTS